jgi:hypothetical protein
MKNLSLGIACLWGLAACNNTSKLAGSSDASLVREDAATLSTGGQQGTGGLQGTGGQVGSGGAAASGGTSMVGSGGALGKGGASASSTGELAPGGGAAVVGLRRGERGNDGCLGRHGWRDKHYGHWRADFCRKRRRWQRSRWRKNWRLGQRRADGHRRIDCRGKPWSA